ncbi:hypothetical protein [Paraliomyxa miuraensis]|uniref:hypothetical protein n=1 Tax=Paraliomyxa miuraensis TaxID=376150 RepID=UPI00225A3A35|nr:hypothetical protein [Paraliomyxa miuraensis]MCX4245384.1 hypothetical protein [Paraliomyxa miuraensis]
MGKGLHRTAALGCLWACNCWFLPPPGPEELPEEDCASCSSEVDFELDPTCELPGTLSVEIGDGASEFLPLADGESPEVYSGPQGGRHHYVAVRVGNADSGRYDRLELQVDAYLPGECPDDGEPCGAGSYSQTLVLGGSPPWRVVDGRVEEYGIPVFMGGEDVVVQVQALDPCGREGWAQQRW